MLCCMALEVHNARGAWKNNVRKLIKKAPMSVRADMEEYMRTIPNSVDQMGKWQQLGPIP